MSRTYSDPSYGSRKNITLPESAAVTGTGTAVDVNCDHKLMYPVTVQDFNVVATTAGTSGVAFDIILGYETGGTGTWTALGTASKGTANTAIGEAINGSVTATNLSADDHLSLHMDGTATDVLTVVGNVEVIERFVQSDT